MIGAENAQQAEKRKKKKLLFRLRLQTGVSEEHGPRGRQTGVCLKGNLKGGGGGVGNDRRRGGGGTVAVLVIWTLLNVKTGKREKRRYQRSPYEKETTRYLEKKKEGYLILDAMERVQAGKRFL